MIHWTIGLNGSGKTVLLERMLDKEIDQGHSSRIVTNIRNVHYSNFDESKIEALKNSDSYYDMFDYGELEIAGNQLIVQGNNYEYTDDFLSLITLLCRKGDILILDEPEFGLFGMEISFLVQILSVLLPMYKDGYIATHCQDLLSLQPNNFYWCKNYELKKIDRNELYEYVGQF